MTKGDVGGLKKQTKKKQQLTNGQSLKVMSLRNKEKKESSRDQKDGSGLSSIYCLLRSHQNGGCQ